MITDADREAAHTFIRDRCSTGAQMMLGQKPAAIYEAFAAHRITSTEALTAERDALLVQAQGHAAEAATAMTADEVRALERAEDFRTAVAYNCGYEAALDMVERQLAAVQYDPAPCTAMKARLRSLRGEHVKEK